MDECYWQKKESWPENAATNIVYPEEPLFEMLDRSARQSGDLPYTVFMGKTQTFREVKEHSDRIANFLASKGIKKGDSVAIFLPNVPHYPAIYFGILKTGAKVVTCNPMYKAGELNYQLNDTESTIVFALDHPTFTPTAYEAIKGEQLDKRNFRKWILERGWLEETGDFQRGRQRPAMLYRASTGFSQAGIRTESGRVS